jgi:hypothetical protein
LIKTPMIFNAFSVVSISSMVTAMAFSSHPPVLAWVGLGWVVVLTVWVNWQAKSDPRAMMYGPNEYLEESRLDHERKMAGIRNSQS